MNELIKSTILNTDSYKASQWVQYPPETEYVNSYIEARGGRYDEHVFFGLQYILKEYLSKRITKKQIDFAEKVWKLHGEPFYREGWEYILKKHKGKLPLRIRAVREGTILPVKNVVLSVINTDPKCYWLTSYIEPMLLRIWYPMTVATQSYSIKKVIYKYMKDTGSNMTGLDFMLHDFGSRGVSSLESAAIGDMAHLVSFKGSDTISGTLAALDYYGGGKTLEENIDAGKMFSFSVPASEHSTITSWTKIGEVNAYRNMIKQYGKPGAIFSVVSDSYDIGYAVKELWGKQLKDEVIACGGRLVVRPDSGNPADIVLACVRALDYAFGSTTNEAGFKVLNPCVRVLQGDGINQMSVEAILSCLMHFGYAAENVVLGMGGALLQQIDRDTMQMAMKASAALVEKEWRDVFKAPVTDTMKHSKKGIVEVYTNLTTGKIETHRVEDAANDPNLESLMYTAFEDGTVFSDDAFEVVQERFEMYFLQAVA